MEPSQSIGVHTVKLSRGAKPSRAAGVAVSRVKRVMDILMALALLVFLAPAFVVIAISIKLDSYGPVFFRQKRSGLGGQLFEILKFRSMTCIEDGDVVIQAREEDSRVTRVGGFLRRTSLDELPQILNILKGEMSFVGPRPHALSHDKLFAEQVKDYQVRFGARPGLTGLAQVRGFRGEVKKQADIVNRVEADIEYIETWNLKKDIVIFFSTIKVIFGHKNAY